MSIYFIDGQPLTPPLGLGNHIHRIEDAVRKALATYSRD